MYAKKHRPMQKLTAICLSVTIAAASLLSGHVFASDEAPQTDYLTGQELLAELREMGLGQDVILDEEAPESDNSSETNTEDPSDTTGEPGDGDQTDSTEPGNPDEGGSGEGATDPGESTPEQPGDGDQTEGTEPGNPDGNNPGEGGSGEGDTDTDTDPGTDNPDNSDPAAGTDPDEGDGTEQGADQNQPSAPAESTEPASDPAPEEPVVEEVPLVTQNDEDTADVIDPDKPETPESTEPASEPETPSQPESPSEPSSEPSSEPETPSQPESPSEPSSEPSSEPETPSQPEGSSEPSSEPESSEGELPETSGITEEQRAELEAYVQTLDAEQVVSLDETDITVQEYEDLCSMLTSEQLAAIELLLAGPNGEEIYSLIMAAQTLDEVNAILDSLDQAGLNALFGYMSEEQYAAMMDWIDVLEQAAIEAALSGMTVNFTNAAPLTGSASAGAPSTVMRRSAARAGLYTPFNTLPDNGLVTSKTVKETANGQYEITLEAYANGEVTMTGGTPIPTDIVLVLDQSGSMANYMTEYRYDYKPISGQNLNLDYLSSLSGDGILYMKDGDEYYKVVITDRQEGTGEFSYQDASDMSNADYWSNKDSLCYLDNEGKYQNVTVTRQQDGFFSRFYYTYVIDGETYTGCNDGRPIVGGDAKYLPDDIRNRLYIRQPIVVTKYTFTSANGDQEIIEEGDPIPTWDFYSQSKTVSGSKPRLDVLKEAVSGFIDEVQKSALGEDGIAASGDEIDHRIAIVGFSSEGYSNTEILTGVTIEEGDHWYGTDPVINEPQGWQLVTYYFPKGYAYNGVAYNSWDYSSATSNALLDVNTESEGLYNAVDALTAYGGTQTDHGLEMAADILEASSVRPDEKRNQVVIVFTDGEPTGSGSSFNGDTANGAISAAKEIKDMNATVYTIGIFDGADASTPGNLDGLSNANKFMHLVSSNYPQAWSMNNTGSVTPGLNGDSYYLSASDAGGLDEIFEKISDQIQEGTSKVNLDETAVLRDVITPYFEVMAGEGDAITAEVYDYHGEDAAWTYNEELTDRLVVTPSDDGQIDVKGFDYAENYVATVNDAPHGSKLVVTILIEAKEEFLGGNAVPTNETTSGIYEKSSSLTPFEAFEVPSVNVPIHYSFDVTDKTIYLSNSQAVDFGSGEVFYDDGISAIPLGDTELANDYVNITYTVTTKNGAPVGTYTIPAGGAGSWVGSVPPLTPTDCEELTITCTVTPIYKDADDVPTGIVAPPEGSKYETETPVSAGKTDSDKDGKADIHVLKPTLNFHDNLTITKTLADSKDYTPGETFRFKVSSEDTGFYTEFTLGGKESYPEGGWSITITGLKRGTYTIEEDTGWSWRYQCSAPKQEVTEQQIVNNEAEVTFTNTKTNNHWLSWEDTIQNIFKAS